MLLIQIELYLSTPLIEEQFFLELHGQSPLSNLNQALAECAKLAESYASLL
jgi:hypothetical protein